MTGAPSGSDSPLGADERAALIAAHERRVEALLDSPQYRVGDLVIGSLRSPRRLVRLPTALWRLRKELLAKYRMAAPASATAGPVRDVVVATVLGDRSREMFAPEWPHEPLKGNETASQLAALQPAFLFVESTAADLRVLSDVAAAASAAGIPTAFWNSQDPHRFNDLVDLAAKFDWIFTTDADCIDRYIGVAGHRRVALLAHAAQPRLHNPIGRGRALVARACVTASHGEGTSSDADLWLRPMRDEGLLDVVGLDAGPDYRRYACFVSVAPVTPSASARSPQVFESLACATPVVSTPARAIDELFGDAVVTVETPTEARAAVARLVNDGEHRDRIGHLGYRQVMSRHTYGHRVEEILCRLGFGPAVGSPRVTVLAPTNRPQFLDHLLDNFSRQRDVHADLIVLTNSQRFDRAEVERRVAAVPGARAIHLAEGLTMGECLNAGLAATDDRFVAKFDDDDHYGAYFLHDLLLIHRFVDAAIVGKKTFFAYLEGADETIIRSPGNEFASANRVSGSTMLIDREVFPQARFAPLNVGEDKDLCEQALERGLTVFSADRFNYVAVRRRDASTHSWTIAEDDYRAGSVRVASGLALERTMV